MCSKVDKKVDFHRYRVIVKFNGKPYIPPVHPAGYRACPPDQRRKVAEYPRVMVNRNRSKQKMSKFSSILRLGTDPHIVLYLIGLLILLPLSLFLLIASSIVHSLKQTPTRAE